MLVILRKSRTRKYEMEGGNRLVVDTVSVDASHMMVYDALSVFSRLETLEMVCLEQPMSASIWL